MWQYQGADGCNVGPFPLKHLRIWLEQGNLYPKLEVSPQALLQTDFAEGASDLSKEASSLPAFCIAGVNWQSL